MHYFPNAPRTQDGGLFTEKGVPNNINGVYLLYEVNIFFLKYVSADVTIIIIIIKRVV